MNARLLLIAPQFLTLWRRPLVASALVSVFGIAASAEEFDCHQEITLPACSHIDKMIGIQCSGDTIHGSARQHNMVQYASTYHAEAHLSLASSMPLPKPVNIRFMSTTKA
jgi:hypothetical protein